MRFMFIVSLLATTGCKAQANAFKVVAPDHLTIDVPLDSVVCNSRTGKCKVNVPQATFLKTEQILKLLQEREARDLKDRSQLEAQDQCYQGCEKDFPYQRGEDANNKAHDLCMRKCSEMPRPPGNGGC